MVAQERAPSKDREIEGSNPLQSVFFPSIMAVVYGRGGNRLWLPRLVRLSAGEAGSHLTFLGMAASFFIE